MSQNRISISSVLASVAAVVTLALPGMASAAYEHPANNEQGVIVHPQHFESQKTRAQVKAETEAAMKQGRLSYGGHPKDPSPTRTWTFLQPRRIRSRTAPMASASTISTE